MKLLATIGLPLGPDNCRPVTEYEPLLPEGECAAPHLTHLYAEIFSSVRFLELSQFFVVRCSQVDPLAFDLADGVSYLHPIREREDIGLEGDRLAQNLPVLIPQKPTLFEPAESPDLPDLLGTGHPGWQRR